VDRGAKLVDERGQAGVILAARRQVAAEVGEPRLLARSCRRRYWTSMTVKPLGGADAMGGRVLIVLIPAS
jgi:hypothetical protein